MIFYASSSKKSRNITMTIETILEADLEVQS